MTTQANYKINVSTAAVWPTAYAYTNKKGSYLENDIVAVDEDQGMTNGRKYVMFCVSPTSASKDVAGWVNFSQMDLVNADPNPDPGGGGTTPPPPPVRRVVIVDIVEPMVTVTVDGKAYTLQ